MLKKVLALVLCLSTVALAGCSLSKKKESKPKAPEKKEEAEEISVINNLTGLPLSDKSKENARPVAIMINNINIAQPVQTGVNKADIVYETEVEGGITRLLAVFKDIETVDQLGTVRSARYPYVDLANGHDAVYIHCGQDPTYCAPHLKDIDDISINAGVCGGKRISNGLASEHTLYTFGKELLKGIKEKKIRTTTDNNTPWLDFAKEGESVAVSELTCNKVSVSFSSSYNTTFNYDTETKNYVRSFGNTVRKDYVTKDTTLVKNVFVLMTTISTYPDGKHRSVALTNGIGYYITEGKYVPIKWTKGSTRNGFNFTDNEGNPLKVNAGKSWVMLADSRTSQPKFE